MTSAGSNDEQPSPDVKGRMPWMILALAVGGVLLALYIGTQVIGVLYALAAPPEPPLPAGVTEITHSSEAHGDDDWLHQTKQSQCEVVAFYVEQGGECPPCVIGEATTCIGGADFSIFAMRWQAVIDQSGITTQIQLERQVSWAGAFPPATPTP